MKKLLNSVAYAKTKDQGVGKCCTDSTEKKLAGASMHRLFREIRGGKSKTEHHELCTYNYSDSCERIFLGDTDKDLKTFLS